MERAMAEEQRQAVLRDQLSGTIQLWPGRDIMWYEGYIKCIVGNSVLDEANLDEDYEQYLSLVDQASREISTAGQSLWGISVATVELLPATESSVQALEKVRYEGDEPTSASTVVPGMPIKLALHGTPVQDLVPLAVEKIEALLIEGLRIQSSMADEEAPSSIRLQSIEKASLSKADVFQAHDS
ncbi:LOW QUALITY PROTEIN: hypothetical protein RJ639_038417 [Escallonia herrerae]|uniref:PMI1/PMIR1-2 C-terminal domain-containing protein n=1 Tax=Escallonia herrerae TaxID=1293975 RepID=A0AA88WM22_9ASTE|nr:LOW QUALITY PROTEIN: hypothetical protein RJ639_038417 [Escallonia herrerae]